MNRIASSMPMATLLAHQAALNRIRSQQFSARLSSLDPGERCPDCLEVLTIGAWPFCASPTNPQGHTRGSYGWHFGGTAA